jgi:transposase
MSLKRRQFTKEFKLQVLREVEAGKSAAQAARERQVNPSLLYKWRKEREALGEDAFPRNGMTPSATVLTEEVKFAELERLIGQLTVENAFLKKSCSGSKLLARRRQFLGPILHRDLRPHRRRRRMETPSDRADPRATRRSLRRSLVPSSRSSRDVERFGFEHRSNVRDQRDPSRDVLPTICVAFEGRRAVGRP